MARKVTTHTLATAVDGHVFSTIVVTGREARLSTGGSHSERITRSMADSYVRMFGTDPSFMVSTTVEHKTRTLRWESCDEGDGGQSFLAVLQSLPGHDIDDAGSMDVYVKASAPARVEDAIDILLAQYDGRCSHTWDCCGCPFLAHHKVRKVDDGAIVRLYFGRNV